MAATMAHKDQSSVWWVFLLEGIAAIIFGLLLITNPASTLVVLVVFLGFYWLFVGVLELVRVFVDSCVPWYWSLLIGVLGIVAGIIVLKHPLFAAIVLPTAIVVWLGVLGLVIGVFAMIGGFTGGGVGSFIFGLINFIIGLILLGSPMMAALAVPLVFGILLLVQGVILIIWAFRVRR
ncbi:MAG TPA: HdeD family acid-resistance protein [Methyloceanibacter sp.]|nr:HdeD family acid-resistance protein [Methyloceanibacter sp.]